MTSIRASADWLSFLEDSINELNSMLERLAVEPPPVPEQHPRALWAFSLFYGSLTVDIAQSALLLLRAGHQRTPLMLLRSLFEYHVRLRYYGVNEQAATDTLHRVEARMFQAKKEAVGSPYLDTLDEDYRNVMEKMIADPRMLAETKFGHMLNSTIPGISSAGPKSTLVTNYKQPSWFVHGDEITMEDVVADPEGDRPIWKGVASHIVDGNWTSQHIIYQLIDVMNVAEWTLTQNNLATLKRNADLQELSDRYGMRDDVR